MTEVRQRKGKTKETLPGKDNLDCPETPLKDNGCEVTEEQACQESEESVLAKENLDCPKTPLSKTPQCNSKSVLFQRLARLFFGCLAAVTSGMMYAVYLSTYLERKFWFSSRQDLEREITFQSDGGVYYYYYKQMLEAPSFQRGLYELMRDNRTISARTINVIEQLSLYPELVTSLLYQITGSQDVIEPIYFYIGVVFVLQAVHVTALFVSSWIMSGTWIAGMLSVAWYIVNRTDASKIEYAIPLRDNWALPYFSCQVAALTGFLRNNINSSTEIFCYLLVSASTFTFMVIWEYSHYVLFVQALTLFLLDSFDLVQTRKVIDIYIIYLCSIALGYFAQFQNTSILSSPLLSLVAGSVLARYLQQNMKKGPVVARLMKIMLHFYLVFTIAFTFSFVVKKIVSSDSGHLFKLLEVKFGFNTTTDFTTNLLLCQEAFQVPSQDLFLRLTQASVLPFYILVLLVCIVSTVQMIYRRLSGEPLVTNPRLEDGWIGQQPEVIYHVFHTIFFGSLAMVFEGLKHLWIPYVCMFAAFGVCSPELWMTVFKWLRLKSVHPAVLALILSTAVPTIIGFSLWREYFPRLINELSELQEFYDPDTVELVSWIKRQVPVAAVFAGSPQMMSVVKLCSGWTVTSLPLYNDADLLKRNENIYQVYAMKSAEDIYKILTSYKANYVIIEEAVCSEMGPSRGCRVKDLLDVANGHVVYDQGDIYAFSKHGRFCHEIKLNLSPYVNYFTRVFWNRSYHVYKVNTVISFQY
ncbi:probable C-mannosyltransferase DPY19L4 isoform X1 [Polyodon spathula]|uniref:probable C-mannosyltransferase DPY19L4 isoform X1 n=1 Tax=Polyodon spathula TaxID=7913 RepID=UPI001B7E8A21|nr:probable C-mannosyltransferase DPY19L4 isoform X1 [Polyodon spathula]